MKGSESSRPLGLCPASPRRGQPQPARPKSLPVRSSLAEVSLQPGALRLCSSFCFPREDAVQDWTGGRSLQMFDLGVFPSERSTGHSRGFLRVLMLRTQPLGVCPRCPPVSGMAPFWGFPGRPPACFLRSLCRAPRGSFRDSQQGAGAPPPVCPGGLPFASSRAGGALQLLRFCRFRWHFPQRKWGAGRTSDAFVQCEWAAFHQLPRGCCPLDPSCALRRRCVLCRCTKSAEVVHLRQEGA